MTALTTDRNTPQKGNGYGAGRAAAAAMIFVGAIVMRNAAGFLTHGQTATGLVGVGRAQVRVDNTGGGNGDAVVDFAPGVFQYANSAGADEITIADIGAACFVVDDQTVAKTSATNTRSKAGVIDDVDSNGVWVRCDEALTRITA